MISLMELIYRCRKCGQEIMIYRGDPIGIPFGRLPEAIAQAMSHRHKEPQ